MLASTTISRRQSEIRQELATLAGKQSPEANEIRAMETLDAEYRTNETRYRAALIAEDTERREAGAELETRGDREYADLISGFELRQVALALDEGSALTGKTAEVVQEMRSKGGYRGVPVPIMALERRSGETVASGVYDPKSTRPVIDRLFPGSIAAKMGGQLLTIDSGSTEFPVATAGATAAWAATELGDVGVPAAFTTIDRPLNPNYNLGVQMVLSRKTLKQSGGVEDAVRRDMNSAIGAELDRVVMLGAGSGGEPLGLIPGQATYGFATTAINAAASYAAFRDAVIAFMVANAATSYKDVRILFRHELLSSLDDTVYETGDATTEYDRIVSRFGTVVTTGNALAAPTGSPLASSAVLATSAGGVAPFFLATWGAIDLIRDPFSKAASGQLTLTALLTADVTASRAAQVSILTGLQ